MQLLAATFVALSVIACAIAAQSTNRILFSGAGDGTIKAWDASTLQLIRTMTGHTNNVRKVVISPNGRLVFSGSEDTTIKMWDSLSGTLLRNMTGHTSSVNALAITPDAQLLFSGDSANMIKMWSVDSGAELRNLTGHTNIVYALAVTPDGSRLISSSQDFTVKVWNINSGALVFNMSDGTNTQLCIAVLSNDIVYTGSARGPIARWNITSGTLLASLTGVEDIVRDLLVYRDGLTLYSTAQELPRLIAWNITSGTRIKTVIELEIFVVSCGDSVQSDGIFVGDVSGKIFYVNTTTGTTITTLSGHSGWVYTIVLSPVIQSLPPTTTATPTTTAAPVPVELLSAVLRISSSKVDLTLFGPNSTNATLAKEVRDAVQTDLSSALGVNRSWIVLQDPRLVSSAVGADERPVYSAAATSGPSLEFPYSVVVPATEVGSFTRSSLVNLQSQLVGNVSQINSSSLTAFVRVVASASNTTDLGITASAATTSTPNLDVSSSEPSGLSGGAIAGIVIGCIAAVAIVAAAAVFIIRRQQSQDVGARASDPRS